MNFSRVFGIVLLVASFRHLEAPINCASQNSSINILGANSSLILNNDMTNFSGTLNLKDNFAATIGGSSILMVGGILQTGSTITIGTMTFDPTSTDNLTLNDGDYLNISMGQIVQAVNVAASSTAAIRGQPSFASALVLDDGSSVLGLGITTPLNQSVTGSGQVTLLGDLTLSRNVQMPTLVSQDGYKLTYTGGTISVATTNTGGGVICVESDMSITQALTIGTGSEVYSINGNGNVVTFSGAGDITFNGATLYLTDIHLKGLQTANSIKGTGEIKMSNVTLQLAGDLVRTDGDYIFFGSNSRIITNGYDFEVSGVGNTVIVDGIVLYITQLNGSDTSPLDATAPSAIVLSNGGQIQNSLDVLTGLTIKGSSYTFVENWMLASSSSLTIENLVPGTPKAVSVAGGGNYLQFPRKSGTFLDLEDNVQLTFSDIVLKDFYPDAINLGTLATITFGDDTRISLGGCDWTIESSDPAWICNGNVEVDGGGGMLRVNKSQGITITGAKTLTLKNMRLYLTELDSLQALTDDATILLQDLEVVLHDNGFAFSQGHLTIKNHVLVSGGSTTATPDVTFELSTKGNILIEENSEWAFDQNLTLKYNIDPANDTTLNATKRHLTMAYSGSMLTLNGATLETTATGIAFDSGTLQIKDKVSMVISTATAAEMEFGAALRANLSAGAVLEVDGPLKYIA